MEGPLVIVFIQEGRYVCVTNKEGNLRLLKAESNGNLNPHGSVHRLVFRFVWYHLGFSSHVLSIM